MSRALTAITAIECRRRPGIDARAAHPTLDGWRALAYCAPAAAPRELGIARARFGAAAERQLEFRARPRAKNPEHAHIPPQTVQLGTVLDLTTQFHDARTTWDFEVRDWLMLTDPHAIGAAPGRAALYLVRTTESRRANATKPGPTTLYSAGHSVIAALRRTAAKPPVDASRAEHEAIERLARGAASIADLETISTIADFAGLDWGELYPEWRASRAENPAAVSGAETYERWHEREHEQVTELDGLPDLLGVYVGRAIRIGYRSDKWAPRGKTADYDHDFTEGTHVAPEVWADTADLERARALVIVGGDMSITERGID